MSKHSDEEWMDELLEGNLSAEQVKQIEARLQKDPQGATLSQLQRAKVIKLAMKEMALEPAPGSDNSDFMWSRVKALVAADEKISSFSWKDRFLDFVSVPHLGLAAASIAIFAAVLGVWSLYSANPSNGSNFGEVSHLDSSKPDVSATSYNSTRGHATIVWVSGLNDYPSQFSKIWEVYSFKPEVSATSYESSAGNATIIWVSGMDDSTSASS